MALLYPKSLITIRFWWASSFETMWVGALEGVVTCVIGIGLWKLEETESFI
jgi:hypothetical protein